jgi:dCMP deaminase
MSSIDKVICSRLDELLKDSRCFKRRVACIILNNNRFITSAINGSNYCYTCLRETAQSGFDLHKCRGVHAEIRALYRAGPLARGGTLYVTHFPCSHCVPLIIEAGISEVVYINHYGDEELSTFLLKEVGIQIRRLTPYEFCEESEQVRQE